MHGEGCVVSNDTQSLREVAYINPPFLFFFRGESFVLIVISIAASFRPVYAEKIGHIKVGYEFVEFWLHSQYTQSER